MILHDYFTSLREIPIVPSIPIQILMDQKPWIWVNYNDLTTTSLEMMVSKGNHPQMGELFRFVNYSHLPRSIGNNIGHGKKP